ncbi:spermidine/putrescine ABC transporter substrate-binding protein [Pseudomonas daroniae]|uniref:Spermidine/putrescine ABC transporter substrate-binding protein n=1 Tax=Phytopseudomonas daroniae TaxID=2487519 RepID=A0A4Q9QJA0_9GAMM|nr:MULTISPECIES: ABC transporter substrate-binding protein [Pseudomonas]TBU76812.1 spermidine/putrescine ABC transporter substrate-binding protein [Pseudomonas daroniae]TBU81383.1 spermidine/putrescine ABC transporter substrate-binding protein [Pseudomonas sp. FRB 228]TBU90411.1 spermidine/putrescine ABC transporter substrate-binding protein [Pseudomonas daroniae]
MFVRSLCRWGTLACILVGQPVLAVQINVVSFGGSVREAQRQAFYRPFKEATDILVVNGSYNGQFDKLRRMQAMQHVTWDVMEVESPELARGCEEGLFRPLSESLQHEAGELLPGALRPCGVGTFIWSMVLAYDTERLSQAPRNWADFWDVQRFPGGRGLRQGAKYNLEFALLADGVPASEVYARLATAAGVERAFRKLEELRPHIRWWQAGEEPVRRLADGGVVMSAAYSGRIGAAQDQGAKLGLVWSGSIYDFDFWAIPRGSINVQEAERFIHFASQAEPQRTFAELIPYGPVSRQATTSLSAERAARLPTAEANMRDALAIGVDFWAEYGDALEQRFTAWLARR